MSTPPDAAQQPGEPVTNHPAEPPSGPNPNAAPAAPQPSAFTVLDGANVPNREPMPGELYFCTPQGYSGEIPQDQEKVHQELEKTASVLRSVFQTEDPRLFETFFRRLLTAAQATFSPSGFRPQAIGDLSVFKKEIVQVAGGRIKARYTRRLLKCTAIATLLVLVVAALLDAALRLGTVSDNSRWLLLRWDPAVSILHTGFLLAASMWGLFFASVTRSIEPTFDTLVTPDADLMPPWVRLLFYGIAVLVLALVFELRLVTFTVGDIFSTTNISEDCATAIFVGLLLGVLERALPQEVEKWSREFLPSSRKVVP